MKMFNYCILNSGCLFQPLFFILERILSIMDYYEKVYITVYLKTDTDGRSKPVCIEWTNGKRFLIDKIIDERNAPPEHTGAILTRKFKVQINGQEKIIYYETQTNKWFVERLS